LTSFRHCVTSTSYQCVVRKSSALSDVPASQATAARWQPSWGLAPRLFAFQEEGPPERGGGPPPNRRPIAAHAVGRCRTTPYDAVHSKIQSRRGFQGAGPPPGSRGAVFETPYI